MREKEVVLNEVRQKAQRVSVCVCVFAAIAGRCVRACIVVHKGFKGPMS